jgi:hypothetical protein
MLSTQGKSKCLNCSRVSISIVALRRQSPDVTHACVPIDLSLAYQMDSGFWLQRVGIGIAAIGIKADCTVLQDACRPLDEATKATGKTVCLAALER